MLYRIFPLVILFFVFSALKAQDFYPGNLFTKSDKSNTSVLYTVAEDNSGNIYNSVYTVFDAQKQQLYTVTLMNDRNQHRVTIIASPKAWVQSKVYNPSLSGLFYSNNNEMDTSINSSDVINLSYSYIFSFADTSRKSPYLHKITLENGDILALDEISAKRIARHKKYLYHILQPSVVEVIKREPEKPRLCLQCIDSLKVKMDADAYNIITKMNSSLGNQQTTVVKADADLEAQFNQILTQLTLHSLDTFNCTNTTIKDHITVIADPEGYARSMNDITDSVIITDGQGTYSNLYKSSLKQAIFDTRYPVTAKEFSTPMLYSDFYHKYYTECKRLDSSMHSFEDFFRVKQTRMDSFAHVQFEAPTQYTFDLHYTTSTDMRKWRLRKNKNVTDMSDSAKTQVTDQGLINDFFSYKGKKKLGRYHVIECVIERPDGSVEIHVDSVKRKYTYWTMIGVTSGIQFMPGQTVNGDPSPVPGELVMIEGMIVYHWFGFFGGASVYNAGLRSAPYANALQKPLAFDAGMYLGPCNYFYFKLGYSQINTYGTSAVSVSGDNDYHGFTAGISLLFPYVHIEGGYNGYVVAGGNSIVSAFYVNGGLNIPINW